MDKCPYIAKRWIFHFFFFRVLHTIFSHLRAHAIARSVTVARSSAVQASSSRRQRRGGGPSSVAPRSRNPPTGRHRDSSHLLITVFARPTTVRSRLTARQQSQSSPDPAGKHSATSSPMLTEAGHMTSTPHKSGKRWGKEVLIIGHY